MPVVALVGMMGSGKTTIGRRLAARLGAELLDSDALIEVRTGRTVAEIWAADGEAAFRKLETEALQAGLAPEVKGSEEVNGSERAERNLVLAAAGGVVLDQSNRRLLRDAADAVVWLRARPTTLGLRVGRRADHRPLLVDDRDLTLARLDSERRHLYSEVATTVVDVDELRPDEVVDVICRDLGLGERP